MLIGVSGDFLSKALEVVGGEVALLETPIGLWQQAQLIEDMLFGEFLGATEDIRLGALEFREP